MTTSDEDWCRLRDVAFIYAERGWPVAPGVPAVPRRRDGWPVPSPAVLPYLGPMNANAVTRYWHQRPYSVLVGTGQHWFDVFRLRQPAAATVLQYLDGERGPVAVLPNGQWLFFVETGDPPQPQLGRGVRHHGAGHWIPVPPSRIGRREVTWHIEPSSAGWCLFPRNVFHAALRARRQRRGRRRSDALSPQEPSPGPSMTLVVGNLPHRNELS